jgi:hypothetical protein
MLSYTDRAPTDVGQLFRNIGNVESNEFRIQVGTQNDARRLLLELFSEDSFGQVTVYGSAMV